MENIKNILNEGKPVLVVLVGLPCSGKSTWAKSFVEDNNIQLLSRDQFIEDYAGKHNTTYHEAWGKVNQKEIDRSYYYNLKKAISTKQSIIVDKTHLSNKFRKTTIKSFPNVYKKIAVVFNIPEDLRASYENTREDKKIPSNVINSMKEQYDVSDIGSEFDEVFWVHNKV